MGASQSYEPIELLVGPCKVILEVGLIQLRKEDVIVNSASDDLDLQRNPSAKALAEAAGQALQQECWKLAPLQTGKVKITQAFNLKSKRILHGNFGERYEGKESVKVFKETLMECLKIADQDLQFKSIAFPAIGTGNLKYPTDVVADCFIECIKAYISQNTVSNLREVSIVVFPNDTSTYKSFLKVFTEQAKVFGRGMESKIETLDKNGIEFWALKFAFQRQFLSYVKVLEIQRIENIAEKMKYETYRELVSAKHNLPRKELEKRLWHGTTEETALEIAKFSFNRSYAGKNGCRFGEGTYFARDASYSSKYAKPNKDDVRHMILARVVVGKFTAGKQGLKDAPKTIYGDKFDSVVDNFKNPSMYVVFQDNAALPQYIIRYRHYPDLIRTSSFFIIAKVSRHRSLPNLANDEDGEPE